MQQPADSAKKVPNQFFWHLSKIVRNAPIHITTWMYDNKKTYPGFIFRAGFVAVGIIMATVSMHMVSTAFAVITEDVLMQAATAIGLIGFFILLLLMARGTYLAGMHTWKDWSENPPIEVQKLITAPTWTQPDISPDILVCGTDEKAFAVMAESAFKQTSHAIWAVIIPPFEKEASIITADKATDFFFDRGNEPFSDRIQPEAAIPAGLDHIGEDEIMYRKYVTWFCAHYRQWRGAAKLEANKERAKQTMIEVIEAKAKAVTVVLSFLLFCLPVFGQSKARQVDEVLGTRIREIPEAGEKVTFAFREGSKDKYYERTGDGKSEYTDLLQKTSGLVKYNDQGGELVAIMKNGEAVAKAAHVERVNEVPKVQSPVAPNGAVYLPPNNTGDPIRPRGTLQGPDVANTPVTDDPPRFTMPSAEESAMMAEHAKYQIWQYGNIAGTVARPWWDVIMTAFWVVYPILIILSIIAWVCARVFSSEGMIREHRVARRSLVMVLLGVAGVLLINAMLFTISLQPGPFVLTVVGAALAGIAYLIVSRLTPNFDPASGNEPRIESPYGQRRIG